MTTWAKENTDRTFWVPAERMQEFAQPEYYANAGPEDKRPDKSTLIIAPSAEIANMFGQKRIDQASLAQLLAKHKDVTSKQLRADWPDDTELSEAEKAEKAQQAEWSVRGADVYGAVTVETTTDSHGRPAMFAPAMNSSWSIPGSGVASPRAKHRAR